MSIALLLGSLAALSSLELLARLAPRPRYHREPLEFDARFGFRGIPGTRLSFRDERGEFVFELDDEGFRAPGLPRTAKASDETTRIVFVGDSFLVGLGLRAEDLLPARVASALRGDPARARGASAGSSDAADPVRAADSVSPVGPVDAVGSAGPVEVANLSIIDTGTAQQWLAFRAYAERLDPDVVVLALYPANDLVNDTLALAGRTNVSPGDSVRPYLVSETETDPSPRPEPDGKPISGMDGWRRQSVHPVRALLRRHLRLFALVEQRLLALGLLDAWPARSGQIERLRRQEAPETWMEIFRTPPDPGSAWELAWGQTFALLRAFRDEVRARGAEFVVVVIPNQGQVERTGRFLALDYQTRRVAGVTLDHMLDWNWPEQRLARFLLEEEIPAVMLLEPLRAAARTGHSVYGRDGHLSPEGHRVAAESVLPVLRAIAPTMRIERDPTATPQGEGEAVPVSTGPVDRLVPASRAAGMIDFSRTPHPEQLGEGWGQWQPPRADRPGGWELIGRALLVLPASPGRLVVEGWLLPPEAEDPIVVRLDLPGVGGQGFRIAGPGPFFLSLPVPKDAPLATVDGYLPVLISPIVADGRGTPPILVRAAGFQP